MTREPRQRQTVVCPRCQRTVGHVVKEGRTWVHGCVAFGVDHGYFSTAVDLGTGEPIMSDTTRRQLLFEGGEREIEGPNSPAIGEWLAIFVRAYEQPLSYERGLRYQQLVEAAIEERLAALLRSMLTRYPKLPAPHELRAEMEAWNQDAPRLQELGVTTVDELVAVLQSTLWTLEQVLRAAGKQITGTEANTLRSVGAWVAHCRRHWAQQAGGRVELEDEEEDTMT